MQQFNLLYFQLNLPSSAPFRPPGFHQATSRQAPVHELAWHVEIVDFFNQGYSIQTEPGDAGAQLPAWLT